MEDSITAMPVRIVPFDLGVGLTDEMKDRIKAFAQEKGILHDIDDNKREKTIIKKCTIKCIFPGGTSLYVFDFGIAVMAFTDGSMDLNIDDFAVDYCIDRKNDHASVRKIEHPAMTDAYDTIQGFRRIVHDLRGKKDEIRRSGNIDHEKGEDSLMYAMSLSFFKYLFEGKKDICSWDGMPDWVKRNVSVLMDPAILYLEDSKMLSGNTEKKEEWKKEVFDNICTDRAYPDYERRPNLYTFMSWSAVVILGNIDGSVKEEYTALEVNLQANWYYVHCMDRYLPDNAKEAVKRRIKAAHIKELYNESEVLVDILTHVPDTSVPSRFRDIQKGLTKTSEFVSENERYQRKLRYIQDGMKTESQRKAVISSGILLMMIAFFQMIPVLSGIISGAYETIVYPLLLLVVAAVIILIRYDRIWFNND